MAMMTDNDPYQGKQFGPYQLQRRIGRGGMADVYLAIHTSLQRRVAIKILRTELATSTNLQRFLQEARSAAALVHPNIVQVYDIGQEGGVHYIAQEFVAGANLKEHLMRTPGGRLTVKESLSVILQVTAALEKAATAEIIHRDIKPENILLTSRGEAKVADFGLARAANLDGGELTRAGTTLGTPLYMSPEQIRGGTIDQRCDLYSLGVTWYHMLCGSPPFQGETPLALAVQHLQNEPPSLTERRPDLPPSVVAMVNKLMSKSPEGRPASASELMRQLGSLRNELPREEWPESIVPLPTLAHNEQTAIGLSKATVELANASRPKHRLLRPLLFALAAAILFFLGFFLPRSEGSGLLQLDRRDTSLVEKQDSVEHQYVLALYNNTEAHWQAVAKYFPPGQSATNRAYCDKAAVQLARWYRSQKRDREAEQTLAALKGPGSLPLFHTIASIELASLYRDLERANDESRELVEARNMATQLSEDQKKLINDQLPQNLDGVWKLN